MSNKIGIKYPGVAPGACKEHTITCISHIHLSSVANMSSLFSSMYLGQLRF